MEARAPCAGTTRMRTRRLQRGVVWVMLLGEGEGEGEGVTLSFEKTAKAHT